MTDTTKVAVPHFHIERDPQTYENLDSITTRIESRLTFWTPRSKDFKVTGCTNPQCHILHENDLYERFSRNISHFPCNHNEVPYPKGSWPLEDMKADINEGEKTDERYENFLGPRAVCHIRRVQDGG